MYQEAVSWLLRLGVRRDFLGFAAAADVICQLVVDDSLSLKEAAGRYADRQDGGNAQTVIRCIRYALDSAMTGMSNDQFAALAALMGGDFRDFPTPFALCCMIATEIRSKREWQRPKTELETLREKYDLLGGKIDRLAAAVADLEEIVRRMDNAR